jgi:hypothetical protein
VNEQLGDGKPDVLGDLTQKCRGDVATAMKWNRGRATGRISELLVRSTLPHFRKAKIAENRHDLGRFEDRDVAHDLGDGDGLHSHKL